MIQRFGGAVKLSLAAGLMLGVAVPVLSQSGGGAPARYTMDAGTTSGMAAMGAGGGGLGAAMSMLRGGGGQVVHELQLALGSSAAAQGEPKADHFMPAGAGLGASVPLVTPRQVRGEPVQDTGMPSQMQMPRGRLLLFWGCGERAGPGQPVVIDFARMARGEVPPGLFAAAVEAAETWQVTQANSRTWGGWPNERDARPVPANGSLLGAHRIASNYAPEIAFTLNDDFMPALRPSSSNLPSGAVNLAWNALPTATGYYAWAMGAADGGGDSRDMVWWTSASSQQFGGSLSDWLSPGTVARLVSAGTVMPPSQTSCTIPAEVKQAGGEMMMTQLFGYGPEANFSYPPRPANARAGWQPDWIARVRFRSNASVILGMPEMGGFEDGDSSGGEGEGSSPPPQQQTKPKCPGGLAGRAMRAAGACQ